MELFVPKENCVYFKNMFVSLFLRLCRSYFYKKNGVIYENIEILKYRLVRSSYALRLW